MIITKEYADSLVKSRISACEANEKILQEKIQKSKKEVLRMKEMLNCDHEVEEHLSATPLTKIYSCKKCGFKFEG